MKTVRLSKIIARCGKPQPHLVLMKPQTDRTLQTAIKANRVMTVNLQVTGTKVARGHIGFDPGPNRQFLIFPNSLLKFAEREVIGINYDLFLPPQTSSRPHQSPTPRKKAARKPGRHQRKHTEAHSSAKIVPFEPPKNEARNDESVQVKKLKKEIRRAMAALEQGRQVTAFNVLKRLVDA